MTRDIIDRITASRLRLIVCAILFCAAAGIRPVAAQTRVYYNDFESGGTANWSTSIRNTIWQNPIGVSKTPDGTERVLGEFGSQNVALTLRWLPPHDSLTVAFDLLIIRSWDGNNHQFGPDTWELRIDSTRIFRTSFSNTAFRQSYPGSYPLADNRPRSRAEVHDAFGYQYHIPQFYAGPMDAMYRITRTVAHSDSSARLIFRASLLDPGQSLSNESWALDNVTVILRSSRPVDSVAVTIDSVAAPSAPTSPTSVRVSTGE